MLDVLEVVEVLVLEVLEVVFNILVNNEGEGREGPVNTTCSAVIYLVPTRRLWSCGGTLIPVKYETC